MFSFFSKKHFIADLFDGMVDLHNHILPGIDDGAQTVEDSKNMLNTYKELGFKSVTATPHVMANVYENTPSSIANAYNQVKESFSNQNSNLLVNYSAEYMVDECLEEKILKNKIILIRGKYLLIEMSYLQPSINFDKIVQLLIEKEITPILAHPERYLYLTPGDTTFSNFLAKGGLLQLNLLSISNHYGDQIKSNALKMLEKGMIHICATDAHKVEHLNKLREIKVSENVYHQLRQIISATNFLG